MTDQPKPTAPVTATKAPPANAVQQVPTRKLTRAPLRFITGPLSEDEGFLNLLIYGPSGAGKTYLASTAGWVPQMQDVLYINAEAGVKGLATTQHIIRFPMSSFQALDQVKEFLRLHARYRDAGNREGLIRLWAHTIGEPLAPEVDTTQMPDPAFIRTVVIDSLGEVQKYCMYQLLGIDPETTSFAEVPVSAEWAEWGSMNEMMLMMIRAFRDLPFHVIFVGGDQEVERKAGQNVTFLKRLNLQGRRLPGQVQYFLDMVGYLQDAAVDGIVQRRLSIRRTGREFDAKARLRQPDAPTYLANPTMQDLWDLEEQSRAYADSAAQPRRAPAPAAPAPTPAQGTGAGARGGAVRGPAGRPVRPGVQQRPGR